jgi:hypothetical protein
MQLLFKSRCLRQTCEVRNEAGIPQCFCCLQTTFQPNRLMHSNRRTKEAQFRLHDFSSNAAKKHARFFFLEEHIAETHLSFGTILLLHENRTSKDGLQEPQKTGKSKRDKNSPKQLTRKDSARTTMRLSLESTLVTKRHRMKLFRKLTTIPPITLLQTKKTNKIKISFRFFSHQLITLSFGALEFGVWTLWSLFGNEGVV